MKNNPSTAPSVRMSPRVLGIRDTARRWRLDADGRYPVAGTSPMHRRSTARRIDWKDKRGPEGPPNVSPNAIGVHPAVAVEQASNRVVPVRLAMAAGLVQPILVLLLQPPCHVLARHAVHCRLLIVARHADKPVGHARRDVLVRLGKHPSVVLLVLAASHPPAEQRRPLATPLLGFEHDALGVPVDLVLRKLHHLRSSVMATLIPRPPARGRGRTFSASDPGQGG